VKGLGLVRIGDVNDAVLEAMTGSVADHLGMESRGDPEPILPDMAWDPKRRQFSSSILLQQVAARWTPGCERVLGVTEVDLFIPMLSYIFGQAQLGGRAAIVSTARLRQEFYDLPADLPVLLERARKEALHELGHTFGLVHCEDRSCAMSLSTNIRQVDLKNAWYCHSCRALLREGGVASEKYE
jgi:archaemetzincin